MSCNIQKKTLDYMKKKGLMEDNRNVPASKLEDFNTENIRLTEYAKTDKGVDMGLLFKIESKTIERQGKEATRFINRAIPNTPAFEAIEAFNERSKKNDQTFEKNINYQLKAVDILSSDKAKQVFEKGKKNSWDLNKILTELQIPNAQKQIILGKNIKIEEKAILSNEAKSLLNTSFNNNSSNKSVIYSNYLAEGEKALKEILDTIARLNIYKNYKSENRLNQLSKKKTVKSDLKKEIKKRLTNGESIKEIYNSKIKESQDKIEKLENQYLQFIDNDKNKGYIFAEIILDKKPEEEILDLIDYYQNLLNTFKKGGVEYFESLIEKNYSIYGDISEEIEDLLQQEELYDFSNYYESLLNNQIKVIRNNFFIGELSKKANPTDRNIFDRLTDSFINNFIKEGETNNTVKFLKDLSNEKSINAKTENLVRELERRLNIFKNKKNGHYLMTVLNLKTYQNDQEDTIKETNLREKIITSLLAENSFVVEVNTAQDKSITDEFEGASAPTQHYSNLTVPGGTNYTENEIATPDITPNIKGHAQFSTDNGIGWFRSDDKAKTTNIPESDGSYQVLSNNEIKTRRILEVQSDLFQKGRNKEFLTKGDVKTVKYNEDSNTYTQEYIDLNNKKSNQFLQLLNKKNNWVNFFIESIVQDSARKGYKKVLFPKGDTAAKIEGHQTLEEFKKEKEARIKELEKKANKPYSLMLALPNTELDWLDSFNTKEEVEKALEGVDNVSDYKIINRDASNDNEIKTLKQELADVESGQTQLSSIAGFYENNVTNILNKKYKGRVNEVTDEYGNKWNEVELKLEDANESFVLQMERQQEGKKQIKPSVFNNKKESIEYRDDLTEEISNDNRREIITELFNGTYSPTTLNAFLKNLYNNPKLDINEEAKSLIKALLSSRSKIKFVSSSAMKNGDNTYAQYDSLTRNILINKDIMSSGNIYYAIESILHEGVHDATVNAINQPKTDKQRKFRDDINSAYTYYKTKIAPENLEGNNYGFTDVNEFVAEIMTNSAFRDQIKKAEPNESFWKKILNAVKLLLGIQIDNSLKVDTILDSILDIAKEEYQNNNESALNKVFEKRLSTNEAEIRGNLSTQLTDVKSLLKSIYTSLELVKRKSKDGKGGKYKDKYKEAMSLFKELENAKAKEAILEYLKFSQIELGSLKKGIKNPKNKDISYLSRFKSYLSVFTNNEKINNIVENLKKENKITEKEYKEIEKSLSYNTKTIDKILTLHNEKSKDAVAKLYAPYNMRIQTEYEEQFAKDYDEKKPNGISKSEYIIQQINENYDAINAAKEVSIRKMFEIINKDITSTELQLVTEKDIDSTVISILSMKYDMADQSRRKKDVKNRNEMATITRNTNFTGKSNRQIYDFMIDETKNGFYYVTKYKAEFNEIIKDFDKKINEAEQGSKEKSKLIAEKKQWIKNNYKNGVPLDKWKNPKYTSMSVEQKKFYDHVIKLMRQSMADTNGMKSLFEQPVKDGPVFIRLQGITQSLTDKLFAGSFVNSVKTGVGDMFKNRADETSYGEREQETEYNKAQTDLGNNAVNNVPIFYRQKVDKKDQSFDIATMVLLESSMATNFKLKIELEAEADLLVQVVGNTSVTKRDSFMKAFIPAMMKDNDINETDLVKQVGKNSNIFKKLVSINENRLYNITDIYQGKIFGDKVSINKLANTISSYTADLQLGFNVLTAIPNVVQAKFQNLIEGIGGDVYTLKDIKKAESQYWGDIKNIMDDVGSLTNSSKINMLLELFDVMGNSGVIKNSFENKSKLRSLANKHSIHAFNALGEHYSQATLMLAIMNAIKVKNAKGQYIDSKGKVVEKSKAMSLYDAYEKTTNKDGISEIKLNKHAVYTSHSNEKLSELGEMRHQQLIRKLTIKLHGQYDTKLQSHLQRFWWGKLLLMFRKWMISSYRRRYKGFNYSLKNRDELTDEQKAYDYETGSFDEGIYTSFVRFIKHGLFPAIKNMQLQLVSENWNNLSSMEKANIRKTITELSITAMMITGAMLTAAAADDDDELLFTLAYIFRRQQSEFMQFYHPSENLRVFRSPAVSLNTLEKTVKWMNYMMPWNITEEYETGINKGEYKSWINTKKILPVVSQDERSPKQLYNFLENL